MLKPQDIVVILSILIKRYDSWRQIDIAQELSISVSEVNAAIKRLIVAKLLLPASHDNKPKPNIHALKEFLLYGFKYVFPAKKGGLTRGIPTSYAGPLFKSNFTPKENDIPVWPDKQGQVLGYEMAPLYPNVVKINNEEIYNLLTILDAIREGRAREKGFAIKLLEKKLNDYQTT